ncbi:hypothetical protein [Polaromonas sp. CG9_12]|nr:hypothetical protein [Polaromonas sp. CG9_12]
MFKVIYLGKIANEKRLQRQQTIATQQTVCSVRPHHDLAQSLG